MTYPIPPVPRNILLTGPPRVGKTTVLKRVLDGLEDEGIAVAGLFSPERREAGHRVGFALVDIASGRRVTMASTAFERGPRVGKYRVDVDAVDAIVERALGERPDVAEAFLVDEIAPMECHNDRFVRVMRRVLDDDRPTLATIHQRSTAGFIGEVKRRPDVRRIEVTEENRDELPSTLLEDTLETT